MSTLYDEVLPGVYRIELPLPFELESVNVFLVRTAEGYMLIDCGMETEASFTALDAGVKALGLTWPDIRTILLTHMHPDHMGLSVKLLELTGAELIIHETEARHLELVTASDQKAPWLKQAFTESGVPEAVQERIDRHFVQIRRNFHKLTPDRLLSGGEHLNTCLGPLEVVWTPGHSPGHMCLYAPRQRALFSGDLILEFITPNIAWQPDADVLAEFLASLDCIGRLDIDTILPSHGIPFSGHRNWIAETVAHHGERCDAIHALLANTPRTAWNLVGELWKRILSPINHQFATLEVMAHLEHMRGQGRVVKLKENGVVTWSVRAVHL